MTTNPMRIFQTDNLDEEYDFRQMTLSQKTVFVEMIFKRQRDLVKESFHDGLLKTLIFAELNAAERNHKHDIVFALNGILSYRQVKDLYVSFF